MRQIPFKPLSKRMLEEPFWLGLITVVTVLLIIGAGWFLRKKLPDRLDKLLSLAGSNDGDKGVLMERTYSGE